MNTTAVRAAIRDRIDPVLETLITRELIEQGAAPSVFSGLQQQQQPGGQLAAIAPALIATLASQQQPQQMPVQQQSPLAALAPILIATLASQQQPQQQSPLVSALTSAIAPAIVSALSGKFEGREEAGERGRQYEERGR